MAASQVVSCPHCQTQLDLSGLAEVPATVRCGNCSNVFAPVEAADRKRWKEDEPSDGTDADLLPPGAATGGRNDAGLPPLPSGTPEFDPMPPHLAQNPPAAGGSVSPHPLGGAAAGGVKPPGGLVGSTGIKLEVQEDDAPYRRRKRGLGISAAWLVIGTTTLIALGAGVVAIMYWQRGPFEISAREPDDLPSLNESDDDGDRVIRWIDASRSTARKSNVKVRVERIEFGEVRARNEQREVQTSQDDSFFQIFLSIESQRLNPIEYTSWYGNEFVVNGKPIVAQLSDPDGNSFPMLVFKDAFDIHGHTPNATLREKQEIRDTIVFEIPEDIDIGTVGAFRLSLPAASFGEPGVIRFEIPESMIRDAQGGGGLLNDGDGGLLPDSSDEPDGDDSSTTSIERRKVTDDAERSIQMSLLSWSAATHEDERAV